MAPSLRKGRPHAPRRPDRPSGSGRSDAGGRTKGPRASGAPARGAGEGGAAGGGTSAKAPAGANTPPRSDPKERLERARALRARRSPAASPSRERPLNGPRPPRGGRKERSAQKTAGARSASAGDSFVVGGLTLSVRWLALVLVLGILMVLLVPNLYAWLKQEEELRSINQQVQAAQQRNADMSEKLELWNDPEYVASQARERLGYVKPGETQYTVVDPGDGYRDQAQVAAAADEGPARPWIQVVGILLQEADDAAIGEGGAQSGTSRVPAAQSGAASPTGPDAKDEKTQEEQ